MSILDELKPAENDDIIRRGRVAEALLSDDILSEAFRNVEIAAMREWLDGDGNNVGAHARLLAIEAIRGELRGFVGDAQVEKDRRKW